MCHLLLIEMNYLAHLFEIIEIQQHSPKFCSFYVCMSQKFNFVARSKVWLVCDLERSWGQYKSEG